MQHGAHCPMLGPGRASETLQDTCLSAYFENEVHAGSGHKSDPEEQALQHM